MGTLSCLTTNYQKVHCWPNLQVLNLIVQDLLPSLNNKDHNNHLHSVYPWLPMSFCSGITKGLLFPDEDKCEKEAKQVVGIDLDLEGQGPKEIHFRLLSHRAAKADF